MTVFSASGTPSNCAASLAYCSLVFRVDTQDRVQVLLAESIDRYLKRLRIGLGADCHVDQVAGRAGHSPAAQLSAHDLRCTQHQRRLAVDDCLLLAAARRRRVERDVDVVLLVVLELDPPELRMLDPVTPAGACRPVEQLPRVLGRAQLEVHVEVAAQPVVPPRVQDASAPEPFALFAPCVRSQVFAERRSYPRQDVLGLSLGG